MNIFKRILGHKPKSYVLDNFTIVPAFDWKGITYYMHQDPMNVSVGRGLKAMEFLEELIMRCSSDFLRAYIEAVDKVLTDPKRIDLNRLFKLNDHLKERVNLLVAVPDHVYKLASVIYFTKEESPFRYDPVFNKKKIEAWEQEDMYDFFCTGHLKTLIPSLELPESDSLKFSQLAKKIAQHHTKSLSEILSKPGQTLDIKN